MFRRFEQERMVSVEHHAMKLAGTRVRGLVLAALAFEGVPSALAKNLYVPEDYPSIQAAIVDAKNGDLVLVSDGVYKGDGNRDIDFQGKAISVRSQHGPGSCVIDLQGSGRGFVFQNGEGPSSLVKGFLIRNGAALTKPPYGGAVVCASSCSPTIMNCTFQENIAEVGGAIYCEFDATPKILGCTFTENQAALGGALFLYFADATVKDCDFIGNHAMDSPDNPSGGGAILLWRSNADIERCEFIQNDVQGAGGGIHAHKSHPKVISCLFDCNDAIWGGAVYTDQFSFPDVVNCTIVGNTAQLLGGGVYMAHPYGLVTSSILWENSSSTKVGDQVFGPLTVTYSDVQAGFPGNGNIQDDPGFVSTEEGNYRIRFFSPCRDDGNDSYPFDTGDPSSNEGEVLIDLDGNPRIVASHIDMGAFEIQGFVPAAITLQGPGP